MKAHLFAVVAALLLAPFVAPTDAAAQATRTWVSGVGDDANPCSRTAPCKTFAGAISKTAAGGVMEALDPGGFGGVTITKSITIRGTGTMAGALVSGTNAVIVNGAGIVVSLVDLQIDGLGAGTNGVRVLQAAQVTIENCRIQAFKAAAPSGAGVSVAAAAGARVVIRNSLITGNNVGVDVVAPTSGANGALIVNTMIDSNSTAALRANAANANLVVRGSTIIGPVLIEPGAIFRSYGDNAFSPGVTPTETAPLR